ncbi:MAG: hypothetical protein RIG68_22610 [Imperialibacter sp.]|uniref:hypothetical protein n=1 Tax=Imperialibacter sp. TaxID=2038411 RepID=UPI0032EB2F95
MGRPFGHVKAVHCLYKLTYLKATFEKIPIMLIFRKITETMKAAILSSDSDSDMKLLIELANKLGIKTKILSSEDAEDLAMAYLIDEAKTGEYVDTQDFISNLRK